MRIKVRNFIGMMLGITLVITVLVGAAVIGEAKLPKSDLCEANYRLDGTWEPVGWKVEDGFPRTDCKLPSDRFVEEDGTWDWK